MKNQEWTNLTESLTLKGIDVAIRYGKKYDFFDF